MSLSADEIRGAFIEFYRGRGGGSHEHVPSSPVVPHEDPTLLFTNAGMNQFKPIFLGQADPGTPLGKLRRAVNSQKCIRAGGKHNDLEDVGKDTYHHTFFEMLGTWSFGDYFKRESIGWAWELLTRVLGVPEDRLYATYFRGDAEAGLAPDEEAMRVWLEYLPARRVLPGSMRDNFWEMGESGPCGPCSEIHFDRIGGRDASGLVNAGDPDVLEIWNHVFIQFNREGGGVLRGLPARHVDTGMGLERLVSVLQGKRSNYDTDVFAPLFVGIERLTGSRPYGGRVGEADVGHVDTAYRVIADHARAVTFAISDGALPSNEGRGYVLRRIVRRAVRFGGQVLGAKPGFLSELVPVVVERMGGFYPELRAAAGRVIEVVREEERSFGRTLARGIVLFDEACVRAFQGARLQPHLQAAGCAVTASRDADGWTLAIHPKEGHQLRDMVKLREVTAGWAGAHFGPARGVSAEDAFRLYDTYGFPVDLTVLMAQERGLGVDVAGFERLMEGARERARAGGGGRFGAGRGGMELGAEAIAQLRQRGVGVTQDGDKYAGRDVRAVVVGVWDGQGWVERATTAGIEPVGVVLDRTCFYAEMGGQVSDAGRMVGLVGGFGEQAHEPGEFRVEEARAYGGYVVHVGHVTGGEVRVGDDMQVSIDEPRRRATAAHHTAAHLLNLALRAELGDGVHQRGSLVSAERVRFDFAHGRPVSAEEAARVQEMVREAVGQDLRVHTAGVGLEGARGILGLRAVFGEAYPDPVRVVSVGRSVEEMLAERDEARARRTSVEFCGGTHVERTGQVGPFVLVSEEAVAKGVRRVVGVAGVEAVAAERAAAQLRARVAAVAAGAGGMDAERLAAEVRGIGAEIDELTLPLPDRHGLRAELAVLQEALKQSEKSAAAARAQEVVSRARRLAESPEFDGPWIVSVIEAGSDREALGAALNTVRQARPRSAVMLLSADAGENKLTIVAAVPEMVVQRGLAAGEWVRAAAVAAGGKGGGRADQAQGGGPDAGKLKEALAAARAYAAGKVPA